MLKIDQNPFSVYDFLGYTVPGAAFLFAIECYPIAPILGLRTPDLFAMQDTRKIVTFIVCAYICGHALSFLSSVFVERYSVWRYDYPSKYLLCLKAGASSDTCTHGYISPKSAVLRTVVGLVLAPVVVLDYIVDVAFDRKHVKALDNHLCEDIKASLRSVLGKFDLPSDGDFLRSAYHVTVELAPAHLPKMQNYVALYGFVRVVSFALSLITWILVFGAFSQDLPFRWAIATATGAFLFFLAFIKFYRRFTLEVLMAVHAINLIRVWRAAEPGGEAGVNAAPTGCKGTPERGPS